MNKNLLYLLAIFCLLQADHGRLDAICCSSEQEAYICGIAVNPTMEGGNWTVRWAVYNRTIHDLIYDDHENKCFEANWMRGWVIEYDWDNGEHDHFRGIVEEAWHYTNRICGPTAPLYEVNAGVYYAEDPIRLPVNISLYTCCLTSNCDSAKQLIQTIRVNKDDFPYPPGPPYPPYADCQYNHIARLWFCDNEFNHLGPADCLTPRDRVYLEARMTTGHEDPPFVLADIYVIPAGNLVRVTLTMDHQDPDGMKYYRGVSGQTISACDLNGQGTYVRAQAYYVYNCPDSSGLVGVGMPLVDLELKIENPPSWSQFPYLGPDYIGPSIMFKGKLDGCGAYKDNQIQWNFDFYYKRERNGMDVWEVTQGDTALTGRYTEHYFSPAAKGIEVGGLGIITAKSYLRGIEYTAKPCTIVVVGCAIPDDSITTRLTAIYPPLWDERFRRPCPTQNLLTGVCMKESGYRQFQDRALYRVLASFPIISWEGSHVGLMQVPHVPDSVRWAWNWRANINEARKRFRTALYYSDRFHKKMREKINGLRDKALPDTAIEDNAGFMYEFGGYAGSDTSYPVSLYWFLSFCIPENPDTLASNNRWMQNNLWWNKDKTIMGRFFHKPFSYEALETAINGVYRTRRYLR